MKILVLGDSHTRAFAYRKNLYPFFMGPGGKINLTHGTELIREKMAQVLDAVELSEDDWVFLHLGEPDCRLQLGCGWHPHKQKSVKSKVDKPVLDQCVENFSTLLSGPKNLGVISATTAYPPAYAAVSYFNSRMKQIAETFIDTFGHVFDGNSVNPDYRDPNYEYDPLHLNSKVVDLFLGDLEKLGITKSADHPLTRDHFNTNDVRADFKVSRFGSLTVE